MQKMTFKTFISDKKGVVEAFIHAVQSDPQFPDVQSWVELKYYLSVRQPDIEQKMVDDAKHLWLRYEKEVLNA